MEINIIQKYFEVRNKKKCCETFLDCTTWLNTSSTNMQSLSSHGSIAGLKGSEWDSNATGASQKKVHYFKNPLLF